METAAMETAAMETAAMETAAVKPAKSTAVETAAPSVRRGTHERWLAEHRCTEQRSCDFHHSPCLPGRGFVVP